MLAATDLRARARTLMIDADRCRAVAQGLEHRGRLLVGRLEVVRGLHRPDVWDSGAATESRAMIGVVLTSMVGVSADLVGLARRLRERADQLVAAADRDRAEAARLEAVVDPDVPARRVPGLTR